MGIVRAQVEQVEVVGLDQAYLDVSGPLLPRAAMRRLVCEIREATGIVCSVGIGPNKLSRSRLRRGEARGLRGAEPRTACARFGGSPPGLVPGIGPKTAARLAQLGSPRSPPSQPRRRRLVQRFGPNLGRGFAAARASNTMARSAPRARSSRSRASAPSTTTSTTRAAERAAGADVRRAVRQPRRAWAQRAHDRDQGAPRRLHHRDSRPYARRAHRRPGVVDAVAQRLLREYAPPRPVRLLGVRVAGLGKQGPHADAHDQSGSPAPAPAEDQLALPVDQSTRTGR